MFNTVFRPGAVGQLLPQIVVTLICQLFLHLGARRQGASTEAVPISKGSCVARDLRHAARLLVGCLGTAESFRGKLNVTEKVNFVWELDIQ
jgi:hypothetical protein